MHWHGAIRSLLRFNYYSVTISGIGLAVGGEQAWHVCMAPVLHLLATDTCSRMCALRLPCPGASSLD